MTQNEQDDASVASDAPIDQSLPPIKFTFQTLATGELVVHFAEQICNKGGTKLLWHQTAEINELGEVGAKLVQGILAINGVESLTPSRQSLQFTVGVLVDLDTISEEVEKLVAQTFAPRPNIYVDPPDDPMTKLVKDLQGMVGDFMNTVEEQLSSSTNTGSDTASAKTEPPTADEPRQIRSLADYQKHFRDSLAKGMDRGIEMTQSNNPFIHPNDGDS